MGVGRFTYRLMKVNIVSGDVVWKVVSCYSQQDGRSINEKEEFYELMEKVVASEKVFVGGDFNGHISGDFNGHVGSDMGGFGEVHGVFGVGQINDGGI